MRKFVFRLILNGLALYVAQRFLAGFVLTGGWVSLVIATVVLTLLNTFLKPILRLISLPLIWLTLGLFNIIVNMIVIALADKLLPQLSIASLTTLFLTSIIVGIANLL